MIGLAVNRLVQEGYQIGQVIVVLAPENSLQEKVRTYQSPVCMPLQTRIEFLRAAIQDAREKGIFEKTLKIDYFDRSVDCENDGLPCFKVCGLDSAYSGGLEKVKHAIVVTRNGEEPEQWLLDKERKGDHSLLIVRNTEDTSRYSSSRIQKGDYTALPQSVREKYAWMHKAAKSGINVNLDQFDEVQHIPYLPSRETGMATIINGYYTTPSGKTYALRSGAQLLEGSSLHPNTIVEQPVARRHDVCEVAVVNQDCLEAARDELPNGNVAVLMFASPLEAGGDMAEENFSQEEGLCRRSNMFGFMWDQVRMRATTHCYNLVDLTHPDQVDPPYSTLANNRMIHVPQVTVFRAGKNDDYQMLENPFDVGMLVSPALKFPRYERLDGKSRFTRDEDEVQLRKVLMTQLKVAYDQNYDTVILGAFGCGTFRNPPEIIAECYKNIINTHFKGAFKKIVFAILDDASNSTHNPEGNLKPFQNCFPLE